MPGQDAAYSSDPEASAESKVTVVLVWKIRTCYKAIATHKGPTRKLEITQTTKRSSRFRQAAASRLRVVLCWMKPSREIWAKQGWFAFVVVCFCYFARPAAPEQATSKFPPVLLRISFFFMKQGVAPYLNLLKKLLRISSFTWPAPLSSHPEHVDSKSKIVLECTILDFESAYLTLNWHQLKQFSLLFSALPTQSTNVQGRTSLGRHITRRDALSFISSAVLAAFMVASPAEARTSRLENKKKALQKLREKALGPKEKNGKEMPPPANLLIPPAAVEASLWKALCRSALYDNGNANLNFYVVGVLCMIIMPTGNWVLTIPFS